MPVIGKGKTRQQINREIRQQELRALLAAQGHHQHVNDIVNKLGDPNEEIEPNMVNRLKIVIDTKLKLMDKYLPSLKAIELVEGEDGKLSLDGKWTVEVIDHA